jgi:Putative restriction endonuclease
MPGFGRSPSAWPRVSDYVVETETDFELFQGQIRAISHAGPLHSQQLNQLSFVLRPHVARSHGVDVFLLTRQDADNNFASDICIRKDGTDPETGDRYLKELAFEIKSTQSTEDLEQRARIMAARGVRRIFAIPVRGDASGSEIIAEPVAEWIAAEERWRTYRDDEAIADPCLFQPVPVRALLDAVEADDAVAEALLGKRNRVIIKYGDGRFKDGVKESIRLIMRAHGVVIDAEADARIAECSDRAVLERWVVRAAQVTSASELFGDD